MNYLSLPYYPKKIAYLSFLLCIIMVFSSYPLYAQSSNQSATVRGTVKDAETNETLPGVNILVQGTTTGASTNKDGEFSLTVNSLKDTLVFSYISYKTQKIPINGRNVINVSLIGSVIQGQGAVVIGYGTAQRKTLSTSIGSVDLSKKEVETQTATSVAQLLQGSTPGLNAGLATSADGSTNLEVRGRNSIEASNSPLIVLDGARYSGSLQSINPNDIASIDVLKGATAAAVYGASAAAGVIQITTKRGTSKEPTINFNSSVGFSEESSPEYGFGPEKFLQLYSDESVQNAPMPNNPEFYTNPDKLPDNVSLQDWKNYTPGVTGTAREIWLNRIGLSTPEMKNVKDGKTINWHDQVYRKGFRTNHDLSISGTAENDLNYYMSVGYTDNRGPVYGNRFRTFRSRLNLSTTIANFIRVGANTQYANQDAGYLSASAGRSLTFLSPYGNKYNDDGSLTEGVANDAAAARNPFYNTRLNGADYLNRSNDLVANLHAELVGLPAGFSYLIRWTNHYNFLREGKFLPVAPSSGDPTRAHRSERTRYDWTLNNIIKWNKTIAEDHNFDVTLLYQVEKNQQDSSYLYNQNFQPNANLGYHGIALGSTPQLSSNDIQSTATGLAARLNYDYKNKYLLTVSYRRDGYSAFGQNNPYAYFPAVAVGWRISDEPFWNVDAVNNLKLRLSYGKNGNRNIGEYVALQRYANESYIYGGKTANGVSIANLPNPNLKWESTTDKNAGIDFGLFSNRVTGSLDAYLMSTNDLLLRRSLPSITGYGSIFTNIGEVTNKGLEVSLKSRNIVQKDFSWGSSFTFSMNRNKVKHLYGDTVPILNDQGKQIGTREANDRQNGWFIGHALDQIYDYKPVGVWQQDQSQLASEYGRKVGDFRLLDVNNDSTLLPIDDKVFQGYKKPQYRLSLGNYFNYRNFSLSTLIVSQLDFYGVANIHQHTDFHYDRRSNIVATPYWTPNNPLNDWARLNSDSNPGFDYYENRSFVRLQNVSLSYDIPDEFLQKWSVKSFKAYVNVRNAYVLALSNWTLYDPETQNDAPRIFTLGINLSF